MNRCRTIVLAALIAFSVTEYSLPDAPQATNSCALPLRENFAACYTVTAIWDWELSETISNYSNTQ